MHKLPFLLFVGILACTNSPRATLLPQSTKVRGTTELSVSDKKPVQLNIENKTLRTRVGIIKAEAGASFSRVAVLVLDREGQPMVEVPALEIEPKDLEKLNSNRTGHFDLWFKTLKSQEDIQKQASKGGNRQRKQRPDWLSKARYFVVVAEAGTPTPGLSILESPVVVQPKWKPGQLLSLTDLVARAEPAVFLVYAIGPAGNTLGQGTGFFIDPKGIGVSNHHVFQGGEQWIVQTIDGKKYRVKEIIKQSQPEDHVIFSMEESGTYPYLPLAKKTPLKGEEIVVLGNPKGLESTVTRGIVSALRDPLIQIDAAISPGSSGSPVMNMYGEVVGIATLKIMGCENCNMAFDIKVLNR